jgi:hypothetical protein
VPRSLLLLLLLGQPSAAVLCPVAPLPLHPLCPPAPPRRRELLAAEQRSKDAAFTAADLAQAAYEAERQLVAALRAEAAVQAELLRTEEAAKAAAEAEAAQILKMLEGTKRAMDNERELAVQVRASCACLCCPPALCPAFQTPLRPPAAEAPPRAWRGRLVPALRPKPTPKTHTQTQTRAPAPAPQVGRDALSVMEELTEAQSVLGQLTGQAQELKKALAVESSRADAAERVAAALQLELAEASVKMDEQLSVVEKLTTWVLLGPPALGLPRGLGLGLDAGWRCWRLGWADPPAGACCQRHLEHSTRPPQPARPPLPLRAATRAL